MSGSVNKVILIGLLGRDPEARRFNNGGSVVSFSLATSETWRDKSTNERKERTEWHNVVITSEGTGDVAMKYLSKGSRVYIEGQLRSRKWKDKDGADRTTIEVVVAPYAGEIVLLGDKNGGGRSQGRDHDDRGSSASRIDDGIPFAFEWR